MANRSIYRVPSVEVFCCPNHKSVTMLPSQKYPFFYCPATLSENDVLSGAKKDMDNSTKCGERVGYWTFGPVLLLNGQEVTPNFVDERLHDEIWPGYDYTEGPAWLDLEDEDEDEVDPAHAHVVIRETFDNLGAGSQPVQATFDALAVYETAEGAGDIETVEQVPQPAEDKVDAIPTPTLKTGDIVTVSTVPKPKLTRKWQELEAMLKECPMHAFVVVTVDKKRDKYTLKQVSHAASYWAGQQGQAFSFKPYYIEDEHGGFVYLHKIFKVPESWTEKDKKKTQQGRRPLSIDCEIVEAPKSKLNFTGPSVWSRHREHFYNLGPSPKAMKVRVALDDLKEFRNQMHGVARTYSRYCEIGFIANITVFEAGDGVNATVYVEKIMTKAKKKESSGAK